MPAALDRALLATVAAARPPVARAHAAAIVRGRRSRQLEEHAYDGLPTFGAFAHLQGGEVLERIDALLAAGRLRTTTDARAPRLALGDAEEAAA